jgi:ribonuclease-3
MGGAPDRQPLDALQARLQHRFADTGLLSLALTHRSFANPHNERLEFLGDSVLNLAVSRWLYQTLQHQDEGDLSRVRASLVKQDSLHAIATKLGLSPLVRLGEGELRSGGRQRPSILADAVEALIGAVFLDAGYLAAEQLVFRLFEHVQLSPHMTAAAKDPKTELQEWLQARRWQLPQYRVVATTGAAHQQTFEVACEVVERQQVQCGSGPSRRSAEQAAATAMLQWLKAQTP